MVIDSLPLFRLDQNRLLPLAASGHLRISLPPFGGSTLITSAPKLLRARPPVGPATNDAACTIRRPARSAEGDEFTASLSTGLPQPRSGRNRIARTSEAGVSVCRRFICSPTWAWSPARDRRRRRSSDR